jgi:hypothetical protein
MLYTLDLYTTSDRSTQNVTETNRLMVLGEEKAVLCKNNMEGCKYILWTECRVFILQPGGTDRERESTAI